MQLKGYAISIGFKPGRIVGNINVHFQVLLPNPKSLFSNKTFRDASFFFFFFMKIFLHLTPSVVRF